MGNKIVTVCTTLVLLSICATVIITINLVNLTAKSSIEYTDNSILYDEELGNDKEVIVSGASLISSMVGIEQINRRAINEENRIYNIYSEGIDQNTHTSTYTFIFNDMKSPSEIASNINPSDRYKITYNDTVDAKEGTKTTVINIEEYEVA